MLDRSQIQRNFHTKRKYLNVFCAFFVFNLLYLIMKLTIIKLGLIDYREALVLQEKLRELRLDNKVNDTLILLEHSNVITLGRRGKYSNIIIPRERLLKENVNVYETARGGDVTYHGPGQLVGYLIFDLKKIRLGIREFVWNIQEVFIRLLKYSYQIDSQRDSGVYTGVWVGNNKITAIGISVSHAVTMHGFSFNVNTNLEYYRWINPCGITDRGVTSLEKLTGRMQDFNKTVDKTIGLFCEVFNMEPEFISRARLEEFIGLR